MFTALLNQLLTVVVWSQKIQFIQPSQFKGWSFKAETYSELKRTENPGGFLPT